ncbi:keratin-associated protein 5-9-like [Eriocheir sinensis]|uniref:keratin-associated protein 5-9-like n=1 Tax=Eriocheir sinensis TaxID=95602 RepID=UPI0021CA65D9|nr:keratin-associated protein 5-9-like [Eriocheir sinensis]
MRPRQDCSTALCGTSGVGTCRSSCFGGEFTAEQCPSSYCVCCEPCSTDGSCYGGRCANYPTSCDSTSEYRDGYCGLGRCICCKACQASDDCAAAGGECINVNATCDSGTAPSPQLGCSDDSNCKCCAQCTPSSACVDGPNPGRCVINEDFCDAGDEYLTHDGCGNANCKCCKTCGPDNSCARKNGICVNPTQLLEPTRKPHDQCPAGYHHYKPGACGTKDCICCVPRSQDEG